MKKYTTKDIRSLDLCYDPSDKLPEDWAGTVIDILKLENVSAEDRLWIVTRYLSDKQNRLFAVWCARETSKLIEKPDPRFISACDVVEKVALGEATKEELEAVRAGAWDLTGDEAGDVAWTTARSAAWDIAWDIAGAGAVAGAVAGAAAGAAAWAAAWNAALDAQMKRLIAAIESKEWD